jgi:superfamily I DNA and/or RNA helicase
MHRTICDFSSIEFYESKLETAVLDESRPLPASQFSWPKENRMVWVECSSPEDLGRQSKANKGQVELCKRIVTLLTTPAISALTTTPSKTPDISQSYIAILTPYTHQREALTAAMPRIEVSSIDGFQGREADIIIFVTVRCNVYGDIGFLADMRRLNVVMTRAKCRVVIVGHKGTLIGSVGAEEVDGSKLVWKRLWNRCEGIEIEGA